MKVQAKKERKKKIRTQEGPRKRKKKKRKIAMFSIEFTEGERPYKRNFHFIHHSSSTISIHVHILI
jgi:hypothetical protein